MSSINSFRGILEFISSKLLCERKEQCEHCDRLTSSNLPKEIKNYRKVRPLIYVFLIRNGEFIVLTLNLFLFSFFDNSPLFSAKED